MAHPINQQVETTYGKFEKSYEFERKFGEAAMAARLTDENRKLGLDGVTKDEVREITRLTLRNDVEHALTSMLELAYEDRKKNMPGRAKQDIDAVNEQKVEQDATMRAQQSQQPDWAKKIDKAFNNYANVVNNPNASKQELTTAYQTFKNKLDKELKNQLRMRYAPRPGSKPRYEMK